MGAGFLLQEIYCMLWDAFRAAEIKNDKAYWSLTDCSCEKAS